VAGLEVHVVSPEREVYSGEADMVVARGTEGEVGILPGHAPLLAALAPAPVRIFQDEEERDRILVEGGFLHVTPGDEATRVDVLAERAYPPGEVDVEAERRRVEELRGRAEEGDAEARAELARALLRAEHGGP
jgi:F-type H+-transporting ATPase subunit epsilon